MPGWLERVRRALFGSEPPTDDSEVVQPASVRGSSEPDSQSTKPAHWLGVDDPSNPFDVPILDLMVTQTVVATTRDPDIAKRSVSWGGTLGDDLDTTTVPRVNPIECSIELPASAVLPQGLLYTPPSMDAKWVLAWVNGTIIAARSWTGHVEAVADAEHDGERVVVRRIYASENSELRSGNLAHVFEWLIRCHALGEKLPFPADESTTSLWQAVPLAAFSSFGNVIFCAAHGWSPGPVRGVLRSDGRVFAAVRNQDEGALEAAVRAGEDVDAETTFNGYTALHLAVVHGNLSLYETVLRLGGDPTKQADGRTHALHLACLHKAPLALFDAIARSDLDLLLPNEDGFTALHASAEVGNAEAVPWLVAHGLGLETRTFRGHTALHIAAGLGHVAMTRALVKAGADLGATSEQGTPLEVARAEGKTEVAEVLRSVGG